MYSIGRNGLSIMHKSSPLATLAFILSAGCAGGIATPRPDGARQISCAKINTLTLRFIALLAVSQPPAQRRLTFARFPAEQQAFHPNVLIQIRPVNAVTCPADLPVRTFFGGSIGQPRIPTNRD